MAKKPTTLQEKYAELLATWAQGPLIGAHTIGELTLVVYHRSWRLTHGEYSVADGPTKHAKETRAKITCAIMKWVSNQAR